jgi:hypothetical protein
MEQHDFEQQMAQNRKAYEALRDTIRREYAGQYVAIAFGRIVAASPDFDQLRQAVDELNPPPAHVVGFLAEEEPIFEPVESTYRELL